MIKHIVCWKLTGDENTRASVIGEFRRKIDYLGSIIPQIVEAKVGENTNAGDVFHVCIDSVFHNQEELERYINHPEHLKVRDFMTEASFDKMVFDYEF